MTTSVATGLIGLLRAFQCGDVAVDAIDAMGRVGSPTPLPEPGGDRMTPLMIGRPRAAKSWRIVSVLWLTAGILLVAVALLMLVTRGALQPAMRPAWVALGPSLVGFVNALIGSLRARYANGIQPVVETEQGRELEQALSIHHRFWWLIGLLSLVFVTTYVLALFLALLAGAVMSLPR